MTSNISPQISKLTREKTACANEIMKELNKQVRKWGLIIRCVSLSEIKVLKQPEAMPGTGGMGKLLQGLGLAPPPPPVNKTKEQPGAGYPSPLEFARSAYTEDNNK